MTTRGMKEKEMKKIAGLIDKVIMDASGEKTAKAVRKDVKEMLKAFPLYKV
jgi:glycine hydroxymethyltransferase